MAKDLPANGRDKIVAIIDVGAQFTHLFVLTDMRLTFSREEKFGGAQLIEAIAEYYNMTPAEAMIAKEENKLPDNYEQEVLEPFKQMIMLQIKRTLQFFYSTSQHGFVDHILLAGGVANQPGLAELIQQQLEIPTTVANPFSTMTINRKSISNY